MNRMRALAQGGGGGDEYKALICLFLPGGVDSFNLLLPDKDHDLASFNLYEAARGDVGLSKSLGGNRQALGLPLISQAGVDLKFATHAKMGAISPLLAQTDATKAKLAFVNNVGPLKEWFSDSEITNSFSAGFLAANADRVPRSIASHNDQIKQWQTLDFDTGGSDGWLARTLDAVAATANPFHHFSLAGTTFAQSGVVEQPLMSITPNGGVVKLKEYGNEAYEGRRADAISQIWSEGDFARNELESLFASRSAAAVENSDSFADAFSNQSLADFNAAVGIPSLNAKRLDPILTTILASATSGTHQLKDGSGNAIKNQTFFLNFGAWDHHQGVLSGMDALAGGLNDIIERLAAFIDYTGINVTLFTASDFGRTLKPNGDGTDHAWGGNHMVVGKDVDAGYHGAYPDLSPTTTGGVERIGPRDYDGRGRIVPNIGIDEYFAKLGHWFGASESELRGDSAAMIPGVLPNLDALRDQRADPLPGLLG